MESPVRKMQKKNDYNRHKLFRKIARRRRNAAKQMSTIAEKQLRKQMRIPSFDDGKDSHEINPEYVARDKYGPYGINPEYVALNPGYDYLKDKDGYYNIHVGERGGTYKLHKIDPVNKTGTTYVNGEEYTVALPDNFFSTGNPVEDALMKGPQRHDKPLEAVYPEAIIAGAGRAIANGAVRTAYNLVKPAMENQTVQNLFAADAAYRQVLTDDGWRKTAKLIEEGNYGEAALSGAGDFLDFFMMAPTLYRGTKKAYDLTKRGLNWANKNYVLPYRTAQKLPLSLNDAYVKAVKEGDMKTAQVLRDLHFVDSAPNSVLIDENGNPTQLYHGTNNSFTEFDLNRFGQTDGGTAGRGIYLTPDGHYASHYGNNVMPLYAKLEHPYDLTPYSADDILHAKRAFGLDFAHVDNIGYSTDGTIVDPLGLFTGKIGYGTPEYTIFNPTQVKSSDPITYFKAGDPEVLSGLFKAGDPIPLSMRDNFGRNDIRFAYDNTANLSTNYKLDVLKSTAQASLLNSPKSITNWFRQRVLKNYDDPYKLTFVDDNNVLDAYLKRATSKGLPKKYFKDTPIHYYDLPGFDKVLLQYIENTPEFKNMVLDEYGSVEEGIKAMLDEIKGNAGALPGFGIAMPSTPENVLALDRSLEGASKNAKLVLGHEMEHFLHHPLEALPEQLREAFEGEDYYFNNNNNTEVGARISQMLNKFGITSTKNRTGDWYKKLMERYIQLGGMNNNISELYKTILHVPNGWNMLAKWANKPGNVYSLVAPAAIATGLGTAAQSNQQALEGEVNKYRKGKDFNTSRFTLIQPKKK